MSKKLTNKPMANWAALFLSVVILLSMVAAPALAYMAANSVNSSSIVDGSIRTRDIKRDAVNSSRIKNYSIRKEDIHSGSINKYKLTSNSVNTYKIANGTITDADISGSAAIADSKISYSTKTKYLSVPVAAFSPIYGDTYDGWFAGYMYATSGGSNAFFLAPVNLPHGALVTNVRFILYDDSASSDHWVNLWRILPDGSMTQMATAVTSGKTTAWQTVDDNTISGNRAVDNSRDAYMIGLRLDGTEQFKIRTRHVIITYKVSGP